MTIGTPSFATGRHLAAARTMAGLTQKQLADLAAIHVQNVKRLEAMPHIQGSDYSVGKLAKTLLDRGILAERWPVPFIRLLDKQEAARAA